MKKIIEYQNDYTYIVNNLNVGMIIEHTNGKKYEIKMISKNKCNTANDTYINCINVEKNDEKTEFSLQYLYCNLLIMSDSHNLFKKITKYVKKSTNKPLPEYQNKSSTIIKKEFIFAKENKHNSNEKIQKTELSFNDYEIKSSKDKIDTYADLYLKMRNACEKSEMYPYYDSFWHMTSINNLVAILNCGKLLARSNIKGHIIDDLLNFNETSKGVMSTDKCPERLREYVRLYFNPNNPATYNMIKNDRRRVPLVLLEFDKSLIENSRVPVIFSYGSAHHLTSSDFSWKKYAVTNQNNLVNYSMDFEKIYVKTYRDLGIDARNLVMSEVLVYKELDIGFLKSLKFMKKTDLADFLSLLSYNLKKKIEGKCIIDEEAFYGNGGINLWCM